MEKFNRLMSDEIITLSTTGQVDNARKVHNHYCFLHVIINLGDDACANGLVDLDRCCMPADTIESLHSQTNSTTYSAILLASRMLHQLGSKKYGRADMFEAFVAPSGDDENDQNNTVNQNITGKSRKGTQTLAKKSYFEREVGNRAHITFHNGNALWFHRKEIMNFIELHRADNTITEPMKALECLLKTKVSLAGARALGIIKCCITGPFQHAFDKLCTNIYEMVPYTIQTRANIQQYSNDATELLENPRSTLPNISMSENKYTASLFEEVADDPEMDALTIMAIQLILKNMLIKFECYCQKYLPGGEFENPSEEDRNYNMRNCPLTNRACESVMATLDQFVKTKPNATPGFLESMVMLDSLDLDKFSSLSDQEKQKHWNVAMKYADENIEKKQQKS